MKVEYPRFVVVVAVAQMDYPMRDCFCVRLDLKIYYIYFEKIAAVEKLGLIKQNDEKFKY